jgi:hypothetical protein
MNCLDQAPSIEIFSQFEFGENLTQHNDILTSIDRRSLMMAGLRVSAIPIKNKVGLTHLAESLYLISLKFFVNYTITCV